MLVCALALTQSLMRFLFSIFSKVVERDDLDKHVVMFSWAVTALFAAVLVVGGLLQLSQVGRCSGPYEGAMLNPTKMRLFNLTLTKVSGAGHVRDSSCVPAVCASLA